MDKSVITAKIQRFNPALDSAPSHQVYEVQSDRDISVLNLIKRIHDEIDNSLAYRNVGCNLGTCGTCIVNIDGKERRACATVVKPGDSIAIGPAQRYPLIRDLVVAFDQLTGDESHDMLVEG